jgi:very-short-patch-repair endonuclease
MTLPEVLLWRALRTRPDGFKFRRQHPIGGYVADFACLSARLLIEVDGEVHSHGEVAAVDRLRQSDLEATGFRFLRVTACEVLKDLEAVVVTIMANCAALTPLHQPLAGPPPRNGEE